MVKSQSQSLLLGSDAQPVPVLVMLSFAASGLQSGFGTVSEAEAESLPAGFCGEPGFGARIDALLLTEQTLGPPG